MLGFAHSSACLQAFQNNLCAPQAAPLFSRIGYTIEVDKQVAKRQQIGFDFRLIDVIGQRLNDLTAYKGTEAFDGRKMGKGIAAGKCDGTRESMHELWERLQTRGHRECGDGRSCIRLVRQDEAMVAWPSFSTQ